MNATMSPEMIKHQPVMLNQILSIISPQHGGTFIDCTFGGGGYSEAILNYPETKVFALDRDNLTKKKAESLIKKFPQRFNFVQDKFSNLYEIVNKNLNPKAIIFDLGLSSLQLADNHRGFSFNSKSKLNMQMGINKYSAFDVVNSLEKKSLTSIIKNLGEEKDGKVIANKIINFRKNKPIETTDELAKIINEAKHNYNKNKKNPSTKTFQAIRIFVNQELTELIKGLIAATKLLQKGGIIIVVSFHSLEDRIVKYFFDLYANLKKNPSRYLPNQENKSILFGFFSKKPLVPDIYEVKKNIRSRSAKLRYAVKNESYSFTTLEFTKKFKKYFEIEEFKI